MRLERYNFVVFFLFLEKSVAKMGQAADSMKETCKSLKQHLHTQGLRKDLVVRIHPLFIVIKKICERKRKVKNIGFRKG